MKKTLCFLALLFSFTLSKGQQSFLFKINYLPNHIYVSNERSETQMRFSDVGAKKGEHNSQSLTQMFSDETTLNMTTGRINNTQAFPVVMKFDYVKMEMNGSPVNAFFKDDLIAGNIIGEYKYGELKIDSIPNLPVDSFSVKKTMIIINAIQKNIDFPKQALYINDSFQLKTKFTLMTQTESEFNINVTYSLKNIKNGNAYFDIKESADNENSEFLKNLRLACEGTGQMVFDITNNVITDYNLTTKVKYTPGGGSGNIEVKSDVINHTSVATQ